MRILYLGPFRASVANFLAAAGDEIIHMESAIGKGDACLDQADFIVSYGYRHILPAEITTKFSGKAINLHISLLPWNRGADPNLWSFLEDTPKGVTIHFLDKGIDTGDILAQKTVDYAATDTLKTSYQRLETEIERLFFEHWPAIRAGMLRATPQRAGGSVHRSRDRASVAHLLSKEWDTPVTQLIGKMRSR